MKRGAGMKKVLCILMLTGIVGLSSSAIAAPGGPGGPGRGHIINAGPGKHRPIGHHRYIAPPPPHGHYYRGNAVIGGVFARRSCWGYPYRYDCRLGWCDNYYYPPVYPGSGVYINLGVPIRF